MKSDKFINLILSIIESEVKKRNKGRVKLFIAMSLDGYIASPDGDLTFLSLVEEPGEDYGYTEFMKSIDTVIIGRKTYDKILSMGKDLPYNNMNTIIITHEPEEDKDNIKYYMGNLKELINGLFQKKQKVFFVMEVLR